MRSAEYSAARTLLGEAASASSELGEAYLQATALSYLGRLALAWGEYEQAREPLDRALVLLRKARPFALILPLVARAHLARAEGERDLARRLLEEAGSLARAGGEGPARALLGLGDLAVEEGEMVAAQSLYEEALELARADRSKVHAAQALEGLARLARAEGASQQASRFRSEALRLRHESREARGIEESLNVTARLGLTTDRVLHAARLFGAADALREADDVGSTEREVSPYKAEASNGRPRGGWRMDGWASLTEREREVAALVAEGMTNQGIAERLVITPATVKNHLAHIFTKLGISRRSELAEEVWRRRRESLLGEPEPRDRPGNGGL